MKSLKKSGFTLMELLVYMAIVGIVVVIAGQAFSNSTGFRIRTDNMIRATQEAENVGTLFKTDVEQLGAKSSKDAGDAPGGSSYGDNFSGVHTSVYMDPTNGDYSSFNLTTDANGYSDLTFRRLHYDANGYYGATEEVHWFVQNKVLKRTCKYLDKRDGFTPEVDCANVGVDPEPVDMATEVSKFEVIAASPSVLEENQQIFPPDGGSTFRMISHPSEDEFVGFKITNASGNESSGGLSAIFSKFFSNYDEENEKVLDPLDRKINVAFAIKDETTAETNWKNLCSNYGRITLEEKQEYEISFEMPFPALETDRSLVFVPGTDHMSIGFRSIATGRAPKNGDVKLIDDFLFFPPLSAAGSGLRTMRFRVPQKIDNVCLAVTFACYSPLVSDGTVTIKNLKLNKIASSDYKFPPEVPALDLDANKAEKKNIKALKLNFQVRRGVKNGGEGESGDVSVVIPIPSNGLRD